MNENIANQYPNVSFPSEYTKQGQKALMDKFLKGENNEKQVHKQEHKEQPKPANKNNIDIHKLMPLIKSMSKNQSISQNELIKMMLPMLSGTNGDINELACMLLDNNKVSIKDQEIKETEGNKPSISSFKRVE